MAEQTIPMQLDEFNSSQSAVSSNADYTPSTEERKTKQLVEKLFEKAKKHRSKYDEKWLDRYKMFRGRQWSEQRPSYRHSEVINMIFQTIQSQVPIMMDSRPRFEYLPQEPSDREIAEIINDVAESDWMRGNWQFQLTETVYDSHIYGTGLSELFFDEEAQDGVGGIGFKSADPFYCFPDPNALNVNSKSNYFIYAEPVDVEVERKKYPEKGKYFKPDLGDLLQGDKTDISLVKFKSPVDTATVLEGTSAYDLGSKDHALKIICYLKDDAYDEEKKETLSADGSAQVEYIQKLKYPNGRKIVIVGGVVCEDGPNPYDDGLYPFGRLVNYIDPRSFWGISEIEQLEGPQKTFNKLVSFALDVLTLMGNPVWKVSDPSVDTDLITNRPGLVIECEDTNKVVREEGVSLQPFVLQLIDRMRDWFDGISGQSDVTQGIQPTGVTAAAAISSLQEAAQTRLRQKARNMDAYLQDIGQMYLSRVFQFYTAPKVVRLTNNQNAEKYFKFHVESLEGDQKRMHVRPYLENPETGQMLPGEAKVYDIRGKFDVKVTTGSSLPFAKAEKAGQAYKLFELGIIDEEEVLKSVDYPNYQAVLERVRAKQEQMAAAQSMGGKPPPQAA